MITRLIVTIFIAAAIIGSILGSIYFFDKYHTLIWEYKKEICWFIAGVFIALISWEESVNIIDKFKSKK